MSRRHKAVKRPAMPDPKFGDVVVSNLCHALCMTVSAQLLKNRIWCFDKITERTGNEA